MHSSVMIVILIYKSISFFLTVVILHHDNHFLVNRCVPLHHGIPLYMTRPAWTAWPQPMSGCTWWWRQWWGWAIRPPWNWCCASESPSTSTKSRASPPSPTCSRTGSLDRWVKNLAAILSSCLGWWAGMKGAVREKLLRENLEENYQREIEGKMVKGGLWGKLQQRVCEENSGLLFFSFLKPSQPLRSC